MTTHEIEARLRALGWIPSDLGPGVWRDPAWGSEMPLEEAEARAEARGWGPPGPAEAAAVAEYRADQAARRAERAVEAARPLDLAPSARTARLAEAVATLCAGRPVLGQAWTVGRYAPAVRAPGDPGWCVLGLRGEIAYTAHDAFEAAVRWLDLEDGAPAPDDPVALPSDPEAARAAQAERQRDRGIWRGAQ